VNRRVWNQPPIQTNAEGELRKVGFELEYAGLTLDESAGIVMQKVGGRLDKINPYHYKIRDTEYGTFTLVLDFQFLVESGLSRWLHQIGFEQALEQETVEAIERFIADLSEMVVPYEITQSVMFLIT